MARDPSVTSRIMGAVRRRDTKAEVKLRRALHAAGWRYRCDYRGAPGHPDIAFPRLRVAVFVDGDFWHGNAWRLRGMRSREEQFRRWANPTFWRAKIAGNVARDRRVNRMLRARGWRVIRLWESALDADLNGCVRRVLALLEERCGGERG